MSTRFFQISSLTQAQGWYEARGGCDPRPLNDAWAPGFHGPNGEWERCTRDTGLPLLVCNRTGPDRTLNFSQAESVIVKDGQRILSLRAEHSAIFIIEWDLETQTLATQTYQRVNL